MNVTIEFYVSNDPYNICLNDTHATMSYASIDGVINWPSKPKEISTCGVSSDVEFAAQEFLGLSFVETPAHDVQVTGK